MLISQRSVHNGRTVSLLLHQLCQDYYEPQAQARALRWPQQHFSKSQAVGSDSISERSQAEPTTGKSSM